ACHLDQRAACHPRQDVDVTHDEGRLGDDANGVVRSIQHLEDGPGYLVLAFDRLIGIGHGAESYELRLIVRMGELLLEDFGRIDLCVELGLEIEPGRMTEITMCRTGKTVDAAMFAAAVGIY